MNVKQYQTIYQAISRLDFDGLTYQHKLALYTILANTDLTTGWCKTTRTKLAKLCNCDMRGFCIKINELMTHGYLEHQPINGHNTLFRVVNLGFHGEQVDPQLRRHKRLEMQFEDVWKLYPRKQAKQSALKAFKKLNPDERLVVTIMEDIIDRCRFVWDLSDKKFIPYLATYINQERWSDEIEKPAESNKAVW